MGPFDVKITTCLVMKDPDLAPTIKTMIFDFNNYIFWYQYIDNKIFECSNYMKEIPIIKFVLDSLGII